MMDVGALAILVVPSNDAENYIFFAKNILKGSKKSKNRVIITILELKNSRK